MEFDGVYHATPGRLGYTLQHGRLTRLTWLSNQDSATSNRIGVIEKALDSYFSGALKIGNVPLDFSSGTPFQRRVWQAVCTIPMGDVCSYGALADRLKTSSRAIGQACKKNPIVLFVPCHRVVAAASLGGYMGGQRQTHIKQWLLNHESRKPA